MDRAKLFTFAKKARVKISRYPTDTEMRDLRFSARCAWLDGRTARAKAVYAVADRMEKLLRAEAAL